MTAINDTQLSLFCGLGLLFASVTTVSNADSIEIPRTHIANLVHNSGHQCSSAAAIQHGPTEFYARHCSFSTLTYTYCCKRYGIVDFDLSLIPENAEITSVSLRVVGTECAPYCPDLMAIGGGASYGTLTTALESPLNAVAEEVPHPGHLEEIEVPLDADAVAFAHEVTGWFAVLLAPRHGWGARMQANPTLVVEFEPGIPCDGDLNDDDLVDGGDISLVIGYWGTVNETYDLDGSGFVDGADLAIVLGEWGDCPTGE